MGRRAVYFLRNNYFTVITLNYKQSYRNLHELPVT